VVRLLARQSGTTDKSVQPQQQQQQQQQQVAVVRPRTRSMSFSGAQFDKLFAFYDLKN